jgi:hypothetical protein
MFITSYTAVFTHNNSLVILSDGVPMANLFVSRNDTMPFKFAVFDISKDVYVIVTTLNGDADVVASFVPFGSQGPINPGCYLSPLNLFREVCYNYTWYSQSSGSDTIHIPSNALTGPGQLYIGVFGYMQSVFSVVASQSSSNVPDHITLLDGVPQVSGMSQVSVCATRDPSTGICTSTLYMAYGAYFQFNVPAGSGRGDAYVQVSKRCGDQTEGLCAPDLVVRA